MKVDKFIPIIEDIVANGLEIPEASVKYQISQMRIRLLLDFYYGISEHQIRSYGIDYSKNKVKLKNYLSHNLTITEI